MKALLSVSDKAGLVEFAQRLDVLGVNLIASGGTARALKAAGLPVLPIEDYTDSPEVLDGRVKTLHPKIHAGILARDTESDRIDLTKLKASMIDLVVVNLYPFEKTITQKFVTLADAIENIDIGGVALIRAAAKNYQRVTVVCEPSDYELVLRDLEKHKQVSMETRELLALKAFAHTAAYDSAIRDYLIGLHKVEPTINTLTLHKVQDLRYGENPHQSATLFTLNATQNGPLSGKLLQGKELSYNNLLDLDAAWKATNQLDQQSVVIVKHLSPCGMASAADQAVAFTAALASDPVSAFGGVVAFNTEVAGATVSTLGDLFVECIAAPSFSADARKLLEKRKNCRLVEITAGGKEKFEYRSVTGGILRQTIDHGDPAFADWKVATTAQPTPDQSRVLRFAWTCVQHVKSNAIVLAKETDDVLHTVGIGGGQPNRVDCVRIAKTRAGKNALGAVMASDAFFPFPDSVEEAIAAGVSAIIQPGGSVRDTEAINAANAANVPMVLTNVRHFRH